MLFDLEEAVCLLQKEGNSYFFVHRSFQEYFTAVFLSSCPAEVRDEFIDQVSIRHWDNVLPMLFDMAAGQLEPSWVATKADEYVAAVATAGGDDYAKLMARWKGISFYQSGTNSEVFNFISGEWNRFIAVMHRFYPREMEIDVSIDFREVHTILNLGEDDIKQVEGNGYKIATCLFKPEQINVLKKSKLIEFAEKEYKCIAAIRHNVDEQQSSRTKFLEKLFQAKKFPK